MSRRATQGNLFLVNMKIKLPILMAVFLNLAVWNYVISGSWGSFFSLDYFIAIHLAISGIVVLLLWLLARKFSHSKKTSLLLLLSILAAYLPPVITIWLTFAAPQLLALQFKGLSTLFLVAILTAATNWYFWVPLGVANYFLLQMYSRRVRSSLSEKANKAD